MNQQNITEAVSPSPDPVGNNCWCHSVSQLVVATFEWTIQHFALQDPGSKTLTSTSFYAKECPDMKWKLFFRNSVIYLGLNHDHLTLSKPVGWRMAIINKKGEKVLGIKKHLPTNTRTPVASDLILYQDKSDGHLVNGHLTIFCEIKTVIPKEHLSGTIACEPFSSSEGQLIDNMEALFQDRKFTDVSLVVRGRQFEAHKSILSARSPVFAAMFQHPTREKMSNQIVVQNIEPEVFHEVLRYIYTGRVPRLYHMEEPMASQLFYAADKYLLEKLKQECEKHLINQLSAENCLKLLSLADRHTAVSLKQNALDYVRRFPAEVMETDNWKKLNLFDCGNSIPL